MRLLLLFVSLLTCLTIAQADEWVDGYYKTDGTYVQGHWRSSRDDKYWNNWSSWGNSNPNTGEKGYKLPNYNDYLQRPSYYDYTYRPYNYTPPTSNYGGLLGTPSFGGYNLYDYSPYSTRKYQSPYNSLYNYGTEGSDYTTPSESESDDSYGTGLDFDFSGE